MTLEYWEALQSIEKAGGGRRNKYGDIFLLDSNGKYHSDNSPAIVTFKGNVYWYHHGTLHRKNGPAISFSDGSEAWYLNGQFLRKGLANAKKET